MINLWTWWQGIAAEYESRFGNSPNFYYDNIVNIGLMLNAADRSNLTKTTKYPAVILLAGVKENVRIDQSVQVKLQILIVTNSKRDYLFEERQTNTYQPTLYPILANIVALFRTYHLQAYTKIDRDYISGALREASVEAGVSSLFNDSLDGIELTAELTIKSQCV